MAETKHIILYSETKFMSILLPES